MARFVKIFMKCILDIALNFRFIFRTN